MTETNLSPLGRKQESRLSKLLEYSATAGSIIGAALMTIPNWLFLLFFLQAAICWIIFGWLHKHWGLIMTQCFFVIVNCISLYRIATGHWNV